MPDMVLDPTPADFAVLGQQAAKESPVFTERLKTIILMRLYRGALAASEQEASPNGQAQVPDKVEAPEETKEVEA